MEKGRQAVSGEIELWWKEEVAQVQEFPQQHCGHHRYPRQFRGYYDLVIKVKEEYYLRSTYETLYSEY